MEESKKTELIDRYLDDTLSPDEKKIVQERLETELEFQLEIEAQSAVRSLLQADGERQALQKLMDQYHRELSKGHTTDYKGELTAHKKKGRMIRLNWGGNWPYMAIAASIALVLVGVWTVIKDKPIYNDFEVRHDPGHDMKRIPLLSWKTIDHKPSLIRSGFVNLKITSTAKKTLEYRFTSYLEIFSDSISIKTSRISLQHEQTAGTYKLWIDKKSYNIIKTDVITPLM
jgi:hypothetical protein